jgi:hypothetical protein
MRKFNMPINKLEDLVFLKGLRLDFESIADLISVRAREIPDAPYVYFYDDVITYQQMNERSNCECQLKSEPLCSLETEPLMLI